METQKNQKFTDSITFKALMVVALTLLLLIPRVMIVALIEEREKRSQTVVQTINEKWSNAQTICAPLIVIPFESTIDDNHLQHKLYVTPKNLNITAELKPEERSYGIYTTLPYKSDINFSGDFSDLENIKIADGILQLDKAYIVVGITDLRGIRQNLDFKINNSPVEAEIGNYSLFNQPVTLKRDDDGIVFTDEIEGKTLIIPLKEMKDFQFTCNMQLNGSSFMQIIPVGQTTNVQINGEWNSPSFVGAFLPDYTLDDKSFNASWNILNFNRNIPAYWTDNDVISLSDNAFGVQLIETVDHYQQNLRSAKYALMFIALTFVVFFFVEVLTKKKIHIIQYLLVGIALILFYSLLLSISEQIGFALAYLIASLATIGLISAYVYSIFKSVKQTSLFTLILCILYVFLYVVLQLEDLALLIGSVGLFSILGVIMFLSRKINWYKSEE